MLVLIASAIFLLQTLTHRKKLTDQSAADHPTHISTPAGVGNAICMWIMQHICITGLAVYSHMKLHVPACNEVEDSDQSAVQRVGEISGNFTALSNK